MMLLPLFHSPSRFYFNFHQGESRENDFLIKIKQETDFYFFLLVFLVSLFLITFPLSDFQGIKFIEEGLTQFFKMAFIVNRKNCLILQEVIK